LTNPERNRKRGRKFRSPAHLKGKKGRGSVRKTNSARKSLYLLPKKEGRKRPEFSYINMQQKRGAESLNSRRRTFPQKKKKKKKRKKPSLVGEQGRGKKRSAKTFPLSTKCLQKEKKKKKEKGGGKVSDSDPRGRGKKPSHLRKGKER